MDIIDYLNKVSKKVRNKALSSLEVKVAQFIIDDLSYQDMSEQINYSAAHIGSIARELMGILAQETKETVTKQNFSTILREYCQNQVRISEARVEFKNCHGTQLNPVLNTNVLTFNSQSIMINLSTYWKFDAVNNTLILKDKYPVIIELNTLTIDNVGYLLFALIEREQINPHSLNELIKLLKQYLISDKLSINLLKQ